MIVDVVATTWKHEGVDVSVVVVVAVNLAIRFLKIILKFFKSFNLPLKESNSAQPKDEYHGLRVPGSWLPLTARAEFPPPSHHLSAE